MNLAIFFSFQAALCFSIAHILIRRGLVESNAMTGSLISLTMSAAAWWCALPFFVPLSALMNPALLIFVIAEIFAPGIGRTLSYIGIETIGVARSVPIANASPIFASIFAVIFLAEAWVLQNIVGTLLVSFQRIQRASFSDALGNFASFLLLQELSNHFRLVIHCVVPRISSVQ